MQQQLLRRMQEQQMAAQAQEAERRSARESRLDDRADRDFAFRTEQYDAGQARLGAQDKIAADERAFTQGSALGDQLPPDTFLPADDPAAGTMQRGGLGSLLQRQDPTLPMGEDFAGPMPNMESPQQAQVGRPGGFLKTRSQKQIDTDADNARMAQIAAAAQAQAGRVEDRQIGSAAEAARHNRVMEKRPTGAAADRKPTWVMRDGKPVDIGQSGTRPGDMPYEKGAPGAAGPSPYAKERITRNLESIDELSGKVNRWTTGVGSVLSNVPESSARDFAAELNTLKANIAFGELTAMREASKTGGALGQVSERELTLLTSALGALDPGQSPANLKAQLAKIKASINRWTEAAGGGKAPGKSGLKILKIEEVE